MTNFYFLFQKVVNYDPVGCESDCWALGIITYVLLSGLSPFLGDNDTETYANILNVQYDFDCEVRIKSSTNRFWIKVKLFFCLRIQNLLSFVFFYAAGVRWYLWRCQKLYRVITTKGETKTYVCQGMFKAFLVIEIKSSRWSQIQSFKHWETQAISSETKMAEMRPSNKVRRLNKMCTICNMYWR